ncbi:FAD-dependent thymidylate synthase [Pseudanabaena sp. FACHB-1998]|uniref:FAD-dependent thymidylate synthase n=1 Tax=Pseudanabaena sp. FACHB-1998 TaxID=2692858 RepID=UPI00168020F6|nr:FAD-dependent thymidylate synthase [Pseudanabaena sp. FACHB-1998]MBD2177647.1 FAD-dependent thymidylate synthase [Pseudanabaena sp. FACHB-1998]
MFQPQAEIIADSVNLAGDRLTTFVLTYHRMIHSEFMTHRMLSKNSSSSRAIPVEKMIKLVESQEVYPLHWGKNQKGMSAQAEVSEADMQAASEVWQQAKNDAIRHARRLVEIGIHKQVVNRLLEPFSTITVICSGTEFQNFFNQRCHPDAQPEIQALANKMKSAYDRSKPQQLANGKWHLPLIKQDDMDEISDINELIKVAVGRCARVSYLNHDGVRSLADDVKLHDRLLTSKPAHLSPFEHVAIALADSEKRANFTGFQSYRFDIERNIQ